MSPQKREPPSLELPAGIGSQSMWRSLLRCAFLNAAHDLVRVLLRCAAVGEFQGAFHAPRKHEQNGVSSRFDSNTKMMFAAHRKSQMSCEWFYAVYLGTARMVFNKCGAIDGSPVHPLAFQPPKEKRASFASILAVVCK